MRNNPRAADFADVSPVRRAMDAFNRTYWTLLRDMHRAFNGEPRALPGTMGGMMRLERQARDLMQMPTGDGVTHAGPSFEYVPPEAA